MKKDFPTTDKEVNEFLATCPEVEVPEKYKTPDFVFNKLELTCKSKVCAYRGKGVCDYKKGEYCPMYTES